MSIRFAAVGLLFLSTSGCVVTTSEVRALRPIVERRVVLPTWMIAPVTLEVTEDDELTRVHIAWAEACQHVLLVHERKQQISRTKPIYETVAVNAIAGLGAGVAGGTLLGNREDFSDIETCKEDEDGTERCSSPRGDATAVGVVLVGSSIVATSAAVVTALSPSSTSVSDIDVGPPRQTRILADGVPCGLGPVAGLRVALYRGNVRLATATTDAQGTLAFRMPPDPSQPVALVADHQHGLIAAGDWLGEIAQELVEPERPSEGGDPQPP